VRLADPPSAPGRLSTYVFMEKIIVHAKFHTGHRQIGYPGKCRFVHGHTWRGTITIRTQEFPRDDIDMSLDFGDLKDIMRKFDHKMIVTDGDTTFTNPDIFEPDGVVVIKGRGPSVENVAIHVLEETIAHIHEKFPGRGVTYDIEVMITETENNIFIVDRQVSV
jgi:6-pyruvoyltetrahydropterin/6-carboxytetrahydropterin synthase